MTGDLPDWVQASSSPATLLTHTTVAAGNLYGADVSGNASVYIRGDASIGMDPVILTVDWYVDATLTTLVQRQVFTATPNPSGSQQVVIQSPVYAPWMQITNGGIHPVFLTVIQSDTIVPQPRTLNSSLPPRLFLLTGSWTAGNPAILPAVDGGQVGYATNGQQWYSVSSSAAGSFGFNFVDQTSNLRTIGFVAVTAGALSALGFAAMGQGVIQPVFIPTTSGSGTAFMYLTPAQL